MVFWDDLGFATDYEVDADLEYPGDGRWGIRELNIAAGGLRGGPQAIIRPQHGEPWLLSTHFDDIGALYGTPDSQSICVVDRFRSVTLVEVTDPHTRTAVDAYPVTVAASRDQQLLLICDWTTVTALGIDGIRWRSERLVLDDLRIARADGNWVEYRGAGPDPAVPIRGTLDARTGEVIAGEPFAF